MASVDAVADPAPRVRKRDDVLLQYAHTGLHTI
jgi:hypothetical protein